MTRSGVPISRKERSRRRKTLSYTADLEVYTLASACIYVRHATTMDCQLHIERGTDTT